METAVQRWEALIDARAQQMDAAYARLGRTSADFWDRRAKMYHRTTKDSLTNDPLFRRLASVVTASTSVLDVGAGTGRFTLALAPQASRVTAVEPNAAMLSYLKQEAAGRNLLNISCLQTTWEEAPAELSADILVCSHVLYPIREIERFLVKLMQATHIACYIYMRAVHIDTVTAPLWRYFHGDERCLPPSYIHALDVLYEMGIYANVESVNLPTFISYPSLEIAVGDLLEQLILPDDQSTRETLYRLLADWLVEQDGKFKPPVQNMASAIIQIIR